MKTLFIILGALAGLFTIAQVLQLMGIIGGGFSLPGIGFVLLGAAAAFACFKKAFSATSAGGV